MQFVISVINLMYLSPTFCIYCEDQLDLFSLSELTFEDENIKSLKSTFYTMFVFVEENVEHQISKDMYCT